MKRYYFILFGILLSLFAAKAQDETDALRYSRNFITGTARAKGLGGAVGALGSDFTSLSVNPAGIALYRKSEFSFTPSLYWNETQSNFLGNKNEELKYNFNLGNIGYVMNFDFGNNSGLVSASLGFGYNRLNNFHQTIRMRGENFNNSLLDQFTDNLNAYGLDEANSFYEEIAYEANLVPEDIDNPGTFFNDISDAGYGQLQRRNINTYGSVGEYLFSFGANVVDRIYFGATVGIDRVNYERDVYHTESDPNDIIPVFDEFIFRENLTTRGTGFNMKLGIIGRPANFLRLGAAYHTPTFYSLRDTYTTDIDSYFDPEYTDFNAFAESPFGEFEYDLRTPGKLIGSLTATFGKVGLISADYEYINYSRARLDAYDYDFFTENDAIQNYYRATHNIKVGGELRFGPVYLRGGYAYYQSPFNTDPEVNTNRNVFSGGLGLRNEYFFMDIGYSYAMQEDINYMYVPQMTEGAVLDSRMNSLMLTLGFRF